jgi:hypothetical protein
MRVSDIAVIGKQGAFFVDGLLIFVTILDVKEVWGTLRYRVTPVAGSNEVWINAARVTIQKD